VVIICKAQLYPFHPLKMAKRKKKENEKLIVLDKQYTEKFSEAIRGEMEQIESEIKIIRVEKENGIIMRAKAKWPGEGEKVRNIFVI